MRAALRDGPVYIAEQLGHEDPAFTFRVYQRAAKRREKLSRALLEQFDRGLQWAPMGTSGIDSVDAPESRDSAASVETA